MGKAAATRGAGEHWSPRRRRRCPRRSGVGGGWWLGPPAAPPMEGGKREGKTRPRRGAGGGVGPPWREVGSDTGGKCRAAPRKGKNKRPTRVGGGAGERTEGDGGEGWGSGRRRRERGPPKGGTRKWLGGTGRHHVPPPAQHRCCTVGTCTVQKHVLCNDIYCAVFNSRMFLHLTWGYFLTHVCIYNYCTVHSVGSLVQSASSEPTAASQRPSTERRAECQAHPSSLSCPT